MRGFILMSLVLLGGGTRALADCPLRVTVRPLELKKQVKAATTTTELKKLLQPLGMLMLPLSGWEACQGTGVDVASAQLDVFRARLVAADKQDVVLQARGVVCGSVRMLDGVVLIPTEGKDTFCALPLEFLPKLTHSSEHRAVFSFENLTDPGRQVFRVEKVESEVRSEDLALSYWEVQDGQLRSIFSVAWSSSVGLVTREADVKVVLVGKEYPRQLEVQESVRECGGTVDMPSGEQSQTEGCTHARNTERLCYRRESAKEPASYGRCAQ
ncbi:hypothetical protein [Myxococcus landrumensis]|uniref:Lipoprotein n=1 Tax=Myxococcus landrumensis TaxID=2813577 RepID=A0ABX7N9R6_9BACT|nr:hypothetical protein [Myxococcus landrumus]QSQ13088.1 hypothetical protein JY572_32810 [Myxococcus landrumus]